MKRLSILAVAVVASAVVAAIVCLTPPSTTKVLAEGHQPCLTPGESCIDWYCDQATYCTGSGICGDDLKCEVVTEYACNCKLDDENVCAAECRRDDDCINPKRPDCTGMLDCQCVSRHGLGGVAEAPDADTSTLGATASGGSSGTTYAVIASIAAGIVLLGAGGWYARRRWLS